MGELVHALRPALLGDALVADPTLETWPDLGSGEYSEASAVVETAEGRRFLVTVQPYGTVRAG